MPPKHPPQRDPGAAARRRSIAIGVSIALAAVLKTVSPGAFAQAPAARPTYRVIVHPSNATVSVDPRFVAQAFLKKIRRWPDGETIQPVDLDQNSPVRSHWSNDVLSRSVEAVRIYWQQMIFSGRELPPPEMRSDEDVVSYVLRRPGSIGYVSIGANLHGAKVLEVR
jgi:ABC-type phosphate transport system substrate-binding protein